MSERIRVRVKLRAEREVDIYVDRESGESALPLSLDEDREAITHGPAFPDWWVESAEIMEK